MTSGRAGTGPAGWRQVAPAIVVVTLVTGTGLVAVLATSLGLMPLFGKAELGTQGYQAGASDLLLSTRETLVIATGSTLLAALAGLLVATALLGTSRGSSLAAAVSAGVVTVPHLIGAASVSLLLADSGVASRLLGVQGGSWPELVGGAWPVATVLELAWKESAFVALVVVASVSKRHRDLREVAAVLGAGPWHRWSRVFLPAATPALAAASLIVFTYTVGAYEVPRLLGRSYPEPLPVMAFRLFGSIDLASRPQAAATAMVAASIALVVGFLALAAAAGARRHQRHDRRAVPIGAGAR